MRSLAIVDLVEASRLAGQRSRAVATRAALALASSRRLPGGSRIRNLGLGSRLACGARPLDSPGLARSSPAQGATLTPRQRSPAQCRRCPVHGRSSSAITGPGSSTGAATWAAMTASASTSGACPSTSPGQAHAMRDSTDNDARSAVGPRQAEVKMARDSVPCTCGHDHAAHRHYRSGGECALCRCPDWRPNRGLRRVVALLRAGHAGYDRAPTTSITRPRRRCPSWGADGPIGGTHGCCDPCLFARPFKRRTC